MFLQACTLSPENADGHAQLASTYKDTGRINEAITLLNRHYSYGRAHTMLYVISCTR